jgi:hypothetical protein
LNSQAAAFASSVQAAAGGQPRRQVEVVLRRVLQRVPSPGEIDRGVEYLQKGVADKDRSSAEALRRFCLLALNLNEFVYLE